MPSDHKASLSEVHSSINTQNRSPWRKLLSYIGPAYLISVGYMDPGNWATDIAGGSGFGYSLIWVLLMSNLMALLLQSLSARLGIVKGMDLAQASRLAYPPFVNFCLYGLAQIAIVACDLAEVVGMAIGLQLLFDVPLLWGVFITIADTVLLLFLLHKGIRTLEAFIVSMVFIVGVSFLAEMFIAHPQLIEVGKGLIPSSLSGNALYIAIGIIGATVMPHNLYLHSSLVQTRKITQTPQGIREALKYNFIDTAVALNLAFFVNAAILILAATAFFKNGYFQVAEIQDAHQLLSRIFGLAAPTLFAIALIASGQSSTITGTLAGQIVMEGHLNLRIQPWLRRLITRLLAIIPAVITIVYFGEHDLNKLLVLSQVVLSLQLGFAIIPLIHFTSNRKQMKQFAITTWIKILAWASAIIIIALNVRLVFQELSAWSKLLHPALLYGFIIPLVAGMALLLLYVLLKPLRSQRSQPLVKLGNLQSVATFAGYQRIGIAVDFSANDTLAIQHALAQGGKQANYYLIHIVETAGATYYGSQIFDLETQTDTANIAAYQAQIKTMQYAVETIIGYGKAAIALAEMAEKNKLDLLVMAAHGHRTIKDIIYGTTVDAVRHRTHTPILVVTKQSILPPQ